MNAPYLPHRPSSIFLAFSTQTPIRHIKFSPHYFGLHPQIWSEDTSLRSRWGCVSAPLLVLIVASPPGPKHRQQHSLVWKFLQLPVRRPKLSHWKLKGFKDFWTGNSMLPVPPGYYFKQEVRVQRITIIWTYCIEIPLIYYVVGYSIIEHVAWLEI